MKSAQKESKEIKSNKGHAFPFRTYNTSKGMGHYHLVSWKEAKLNDEYKQLTEGMFEEQAARIIQRRWRNYSFCEFKGKYNETLNGKLSIRFLKEPLDDKYKAHAEKINTNEWYNVDYDDPEFVRNIFKALRKGNLSVDRAILAKMLYDASIEFKAENKSNIPVLRQIPCDEEGACLNRYQPKSISYMSETMFSDFKNKIQKLSPTDRNYFIINFPKKREMLFFHNWLGRPNVSTRHSREQIKNLYLAFLVTKINWDDHSTIEKIRNELQALDVKNIPSELDFAYFFDAVENANKQESRPEAVKILRAALTIIHPYNINYFYRGHTPDSSLKNLDKRDRDLESSLLLLAFFDVFEEQGPCISVSPDFDRKNPDSPFLCMILPSLPLFKELVTILYGKKQVTLPYYTLGQISTRKIRECDDKNQTRPGEVTHPDLKSSLVPHGNYAHDFILSWHDIFFHTMRNGLNLNKKLYRFIKSVFTQTTGFYMSKLIWSLTDMDANVNWPSIRIKEAQAKNNKQEEKLLLAKLFMIAMECVKDFWWGRYQHDTLIIIFNIILNPEDWRYILKEFPEKHIEQSVALFKLIPEHNNFTIDLFQKTYQKCKEIVKLLPNQPVEFYILLAQLNQNNEISINKLNSYLYIKTYLKRLVKWDRNTGLHFSKECLMQQDTSIEKMDPESLEKNINHAIANLQKKCNIPIIRKSIGNMRFFSIKARRIISEYVDNDMTINFDSNERNTAWINSAFAISFFRANKDNPLVVNATPRVASQLRIFL